MSVHNCERPDARVAERLRNGLQVHSLRLDPGTGFEALYGFRDYDNALSVSVSESRDPLKIRKKQEFSRTDKRKGENWNL